MSSGTFQRALQQTTELSSNVITKVINETEPDNRGMQDAAAMADAFLPLVPSNDYDYLVAINHQAGGTMAPYALDGSMQQVTLPHVDYIREQGELNYREYIHFGEADLTRLMKKNDLNAKMAASDMVSEGTGVLQRRFTNLRAAKAADLLFNNRVYEDRNDVSVNRTSIFPSYFFLDLHDTETSGYTDVRDLPGIFAWTPGALWSTTASATPDIDLVKAVTFAQDVLNTNITEIWYDDFVAQYLDLNTTFNDIMKRHSLDRIEELFGTDKLPKLKGLTAKRINPKINLVTILTRDYTIGSDTTMTVDSITDIGLNDSISITYKDSAGRVKFAFGTTSDSVAAAGNTITLAAYLAGSGTIEAGTPIVIAHRMVPKGYVILKSDRTDLQQMTTYPSAWGSAISSPKPGYRAEAEFSPEPAKRPYVDIVGGLNASIDAHMPGQFIILRVL